MKGCIKTVPIIKHFHTAPETVRIFQSTSSLRNFLPYCRVLVLEVLLSGSYCSSLNFHDNL